MGFQQNKVSVLCFALILMGIASWKHFYDLLRWSQEFSSIYLTRHRHRYEEDVHVWELETNCGIHHPCPSNSFPIFLSTDNQPKLCVDGKYVIKPLEKDEGRGLNAAVVESTNFKVISVRNFDTYQFNKSIEISDWLDGILEDDILIMFTSDEASAKLSSETKALLNQLGSGKIQNLQYRSQWFMITQKGTTGFTTYEKITYSKKKSWGDTIEFRGCVPRKIPKKLTTADEPLKQNRKKVQFCEGKTHDKYKGFCNEPRFEIIMPALITNKSLLENLVFKLPIFIYASEDLEILISAVDNMLHQPGVASSLITILYENNTDVEGIARIYSMHSNKTKFSDTFEDRLVQARELSRRLYPKKKYLIVLDSDVLPTPDFLFFFAQTAPIIEKDTNVSAISAWSCNCYEHNGNVHTMYRVKGVPKYAALIPALSDDQSFYGDLYTPDVSRVQGSEACHLPSLQSDNYIDRPQDLQKDRYFHKLVMLQRIAQVVEEEDITTTCSHTAIKNDTNIIYLESTENSLHNLLYCLGIKENQYGEYDGIIRLQIEEKAVLLVTDQSSFYKSRPIFSALELTKNEPKTSTQIGLAYSPAKTVMYEKQPMQSLPKIRVDPAYKVGTIYSPQDGLKSTYNETFKIPTQEGVIDVSNSKLLKQPREYSKLGKHCRPISFGMTEYKAEYPVKVLPQGSRGVSVIDTTTCPMILTGRDERDPLPLTANVGKHLDIYLSTTRMTHRTFTLQEQTSIAAKNNVTSQETMDIPKGRGFGCKYPAFPGQDLDNREKNMTDKVLFKSEHKIRFMPRGMPKVPNFGCESETQASYQRPDGVAIPRLFDRFIEFPDAIVTPTANQTLSVPGMYTTESSAINNHISPQAVV